MTGQPETLYAEGPGLGGVSGVGRIMDAVRDLGIEIRAGLHAGEVELRGDDIGGIAVNTASRVTDEAGAGEILVSGTVKEFVVGSGIEFVDRGHHELRDLDGKWQLFAHQP